MHLVQVCICASVHLCKWPYSWVQVPKNHLSGLRVPVLDRRYIPFLVVDGCSSLADCLNHSELVSLERLIAFSLAPFPAWTCLGFLLSYAPTYMFSLPAIASANIRMITGIIRSLSRDLKTSRKVPSSGGSWSSSSSSSSPGSVKPCPWSNLVWDES